jgi:hypothetical protein
LASSVPASRPAEPAIDDSLGSADTAVDEPEHNGSAGSASSATSTENRSNKTPDSSAPTTAVLPSPASASGPARRVTDAAPDSDSMTVDEPVRKRPVRRQAQGAASTSATVRPTPSPGVAVALGSATEQQEVDKMVNFMKGLLYEDS